LAPIEEAVVASHNQADVRQDLESRLIAIVQGDVSRDAKEYACRKLAIVGSADAVPALTSLLGHKEYSHMARMALERIPLPEAGQALRGAVAGVSSELKVGVIGSLGSRRDTAAVAILKGLLNDGDPAVARAAAGALGSIGSVEAASALKAAISSAGANPAAVIDALLACAEALLASENRTDALAIYRSLAADNESRLVRLAATRGILACTRKQS
jgi:HEAT repeat protein